VPKAVASTVTTMWRADTQPTPAPTPMPPTMAPTAQPTFNPSVVSLLRVNCGGASFTDADTGLVWSADAYFNNKGTSSGDATLAVINGGSLGKMYQSNRWVAATSLTVLYNLPCPPGIYTIRLYFANQYSGTSAIGQRVFDIAVQGVVVRSAFDIVAAGGHNTGALSRSLS